MSMDPTTGLPSLPEGQRWRVWDDSMGIQVERTRKTLFRRRVVHAGWDIPDDAHWKHLDTWAFGGVITPDLLRTTAHEIVQAVRRKKQRDDARVKYVGAYPPNRLESW